MLKKYFLLFSTHLACAMNSGEKYQPLSDSRMSYEVSLKRLAPLEKDFQSKMQEFSSNVLKTLENLEAICFAEKFFGNMVSRVYGKYEEESIEGKFISEISPIKNSEFKELVKILRESSFKDQEPAIIGYVLEKIIKCTKGQDLYLPRKNDLLSELRRDALGAFLTVTLFNGIEIVKSDAFLINY